MALTHFREWWPIAKPRMILSFNCELSSMFFSFATRTKKVTEPATPSSYKELRANQAKELIRKQDFVPDLKRLQGGFRISSKGGQ